MPDVAPNSWRTAELQWCIRHSPMLMYRHRKWSELKRREHTAETVSKKPECFIAPTPEQQILVPIHTNTSAVPNHHHTNDAEQLKASKHYPLSPSFHRHRLTRARSAGLDWDPRSHFNHLSKICIQITHTSAPSPPIMHTSAQWPPVTHTSAQWPPVTHTCAKTHSNQMNHTFIVGCGYVSH